MNIAIENGEVKLSWPSREEIENAVRICCGRHCKACETPVEYAWRKRRVDFSHLVDAAIERELTQSEKEVIKEIYFKGRSTAEVAAGHGKTSATVSGTHKRALGKLRHALDYAAMYRDDYIGEGESGPMFYDAMKIAAARRARGSTFAAKLRNLRVACALSEEAAAKGMKIPLSRLRSLERGTGVPSKSETDVICAFYGREEDYFYGEKDG